MSLLEKYINPIYLTTEGKNKIKEDLKSKSFNSYITLDHFFIESMLEDMRKEQENVIFNPHADSRLNTDSNIKFPFDGAAAECDPDTLLGELLYSREWYKYFLEILDIDPVRVWPVIKIRYNKENAKGYWLHNDKPGAPIGFERITTILAYFNKNWTVEDGGLLQIWQESPVKNLSTPSYDKEDYIDTDKALNFLEQPRINIWPYGAEWGSDEKKDFVLVDQIVPTYNRVVIFNLNKNPLYHSVTPNYGKRRDGFIQWLNKEA